MDRHLDDRIERTYKEGPDREEHGTTGGTAAGGAATGLGGSANLRARTQPAMHDEAYRSTGAPAGAAGTLAEDERIIELREEQLVAHKDLREVGEVQIRTQVEEFPGRLEVEAYREEVEVEHVPVGQVVKERVAPWEEEGVVVVPVYEEQLVVVKRLVLREHLRIRRVGTTETRRFEDTLRRERLVIEDPNNTGLVHEQFPTEQVSTEPGEEDTRTRDEARQREEGGFLQNLVRKLQ